MHKFLLTFSLFLSFFVSQAQVAGDTIVIPTFAYTTTNRDSVFQFPSNPSITYEKVLMLYSIRCKNGLVSNGTNTNLGCGEWDYSCNTYVIDSTRTDSVSSTRPSHSISNYSGTTYPYAASPYYNLYQYSTTNTVVSSITSETQSTLGTSSLGISEAIDAAKKSGKSQYLFSQAELASAGLVMGNIDGLLLYAQSNSTANFLKVRLKSTNQTVLSAAIPDLTGFTEVYYNATTFIPGSNRLQFSTPFYWDGVSNVLVEFSFTNSTPSGNLVLDGDSYGSNLGLYTSNGSYIHTGSGAGGIISTAPFASISNQITVSFWSKGDPGIGGRNTSILEGVTSSKQRTLNIHHPWSNSNIYFDCGNSGGTYDRINKLASAAELEAWNYWTFTKNTTSGVMNIYLNGTLWHTGSGKTLPIAIDSLHLGMNINSSNIFTGGIDELVIFNEELSQATIQAWMHKTIDNTHPNYSGLVAYYHYDEASGNVGNDASVNAQSTNFPNTPDWRFQRGENLFTRFTETINRPKLSFLQGTYIMTNTPVIAMDSLLASPNVVKTYSVSSNAGTQQFDQYNLVSSVPSWLATYKYTYDGVTGAAIDSIAITPAGTITITSLPFKERYPSKYELMSFVTPYGINLNLGMAGKTWTFDMTDYLPILKNSRRMTIEGGAWQEDMDIKFLFIVGTPPHDVKNISNIWRQANGVNYTQIINDVYYEPRTVIMDPSAVKYKIRSAITGHGQEGEFIPRQHFIDINGGSDEFVWDVWKKCATNPVYPQGGTWVYDRAGWCPGMATDLQELDITPHVTSGQPATIDYGMYTASGDSRYIVSNQLVSYGEMNFNLDASVQDILAPSTKIEYIRNQAICANPKIIIQNTGSTPITSLTIEYWINSNPIKSTYNWTGNLASLAKEEVELPNTTLWSGIVASGNEFHVEVKNPNGSADQYTYNNHMKSAFNLPDVVPSNFVIYYKANNAASETKYELFDEAGNSLLLRQGLANNSLTRDTMLLAPGCYKLVMTDSDEDGISWWANNDGTGVFRLQRATNSTVLKTFNPDFGASIIYNFTVDYPLSYEEFQFLTEVNVFPNPAQNQFTISMKDIEKNQVQMLNSIGQQVYPAMQTTPGEIKVSTHGLSKGIYFIKVMGDFKQHTEKIIIE